jgi:hypothetical protein
MKIRTDILILSMVISLLSLSVNAQNFIGLNKTEIAELIKVQHPQFKLDKNAVNPTYKYLKYVDKISEQTILFFLSDTDICTYVRWMSDYSNLNDMINMLNSTYKKNGVNAWTFTDKGVRYTVKLEEEEWYFTISFRRI